MHFDKDYEADIANIISADFIDFEKLRNKTVFITGATGLIGTSIINTLVAANKQLNLNCRIIAFVRSIEKAQSIFGNAEIEYLIGDITKPFQLSHDVDFIIHAASDTSSKHFVDQPLQIVNTTIDGTKNILSFAAEKHASKAIFLSTMEVYGRPENDEKISETHSTNLQTTEVRNCYPISKRMAEYICFCYAQTENININILRLTQTFGPGVRYDDGRVFADFSRCAIENRDIILHTTGDTKRQYLYVLDAVSAILAVLTSDSENQIYNVANESTYCSILEMANLVAGLGKHSKVKVELENDLQKYGYAPTLCMNLDTAKIQKLGWKPSKDLKQMFVSLINYYKSQQKETTNE